MRVLVGSIGGLIVAFFVISTPAYAYLDPSTGSMFLQAALASLAAGGALIGGYWRQLRDLFTRWTSSEKSDKR